MKAFHRTGLPAAAGLIVLCAMATAEEIDSRKDPEQALAKLTAIIRDARRPAEERAEAVQAVGQLLGTTKRIVKFSPGTAVMTGGLSEVLFGLILRDSVVPEARFPAVTELLAGALADPTEVVRAAAMLVLRDADPRISLPAFTRAMKGPDARAALTAAKALQDMALRLVAEDARLAVLSRSDSTEALAAALPAFEEAERSPSAELSRQAERALAQLRSAIRRSIEAVVKASDPELLRVTPEALLAPGYGAELKAALPAFRARLGDPDYRVRRAAATAVWLVEGASTETLNDLAARLWTGLKLPGELRPEEKEKLARALRKAETDPGTFDHRNVILDLGPKATAAVPVLRKRLALLENDYRYDLASELLSLGLIGPAARPAAGEIEKYLGSQDSKIRVAAAIALAHVQQDSRALPILRDGFNPMYIERNLAVLYLAPEDEVARRILHVPLGEPLLLALTKLAIREPNVDFNLEIFAILLREQNNAPWSPK